MDTFRTPTGKIGMSMKDAKNVEDLMSAPGGLVVASQI